jgi:hypothetical protein
MRVLTFSHAAFQVHRDVNGQTAITVLDYVHLALSSLCHIDFEVCSKRLLYHGQM